MEFRVIWEIDIDADSPKQATEQARAVQLDPGMPATVFEVWEYAKQKMQRVDLAAQPDRLDKASKWLLCAPHSACLQCAPGPRREIERHGGGHADFPGCGGRMLKTPWS